MKSKLDRCARIVGSQSMTDCPWGRMRYTDVLGILLKLEEDGASAATINCYLSALKGVALHAWKIRQLDQEEYLRIKTIRSRRTSRLPTGRALSMGESHRLLTASHRGVSEIVDVRDRAILSIMIGCGLRHAEVTGLKMDSYDAQDMSLRLIGKGNKRESGVPAAGSGCSPPRMDSFLPRLGGGMALLPNLPRRKAGEKSPVE